MALIQFFVEHKFVSSQSALGILRLERTAINMDKALRQKAYSLVKLLADSCQHTFVPTKDERELLEILADTLKILNNDGASYKASDYALLRLYNLFTRLIGFKAVVLAPETKACFLNLETFIQGEALADLRGVSGPKF